MKMDYIEISAKTVDDAITEAIIKLGTTHDKIEYEVIEKGSAGFLGINRKDAVIRARKKNDTNDNIRDFLESVFKAMGLTVTIQIEKIWGPYASSGSRILRVNMTNIRKKIEKIPMDPTYITTIPRVGYRMLESQTASVV